MWFSLLLSLPVVFYSYSMFFTAAVQALKARTLDMMVLVAVAVGTGLALLGRGHADRRRGRLLLGRCGPVRVCAPGALVGDARAVADQHSDPKSARLGAADGRGGA